MTITRKTFSRRRRMLTVSIGTGITLLTAGCGIFFSQKGSKLARATATKIVNRFSPPPYPNFADAKTVIAQAQSISDKLEQYVKDWLDGKVSSAIPDNLLPNGRDPRIVNYFLQHPEEVVPEQQWGVREAEPITPGSYVGQYPDPHATYLVMRHFFVPFGCRVIIDGQFPHSRFFDIQVTPSFDPYAYRYNGFTGVGEVPIVDVDIEPLPGNVNPFHVGADRTAKNRSYQVTYNMAVGNPVDLNSAFRPPYYRAPGNTRFGGSIMYQGPWGEKQYSPPGDGRGLWDTGSIWIRYYAPDKAAGPLGGVPLPRVLYQLPDGRAFYINADISHWIQQDNEKKPLPQTLPHNPDGTYSIATFGWLKQWGIFRELLEFHVKNKGYLRDMDLGVAGRGEELPAPGNLEPSATTCTYINYLGRGMSLGAGKIAVLTGTLPTTPRTRNGEATMGRGQARYWSITTYAAYIDTKDNFSGAPMNALMDDEIITDSQNRYIIVYSRPEDRPTNATPENGVTWVNWGPVSKGSWTLRWLSVAPDWSFAQAPNERNLGWATDVSSTSYNSALIGENNQNGFLGKYQPLVHYLTKQQFESLNRPVSSESVPLWT
jgi:hypothetical protein